MEVEISSSSDATLHYVAPRDKAESYRQSSRMRFSRYDPGIAFGALWLCAGIGGFEWNLTWHIWAGFGIGFLTCLVYLKTATPLK
jgi:hypothetical protein